MDLYSPLLNKTKDGSVPSQQDTIRRFFGYFQFFKFWLNEQPLNGTTEFGYPSSLVGLTIPFGYPADQCVDNYSANLTLQDMAYQAYFKALDENTGRCNIPIVFWWRNSSSMDFYDKRETNSWGCSWTVRGEPAEYTIAKAFDEIC